MPPSGQGKKKVLLVGEGPALNEDREGLQFVGDSGQLLERILREISVDMRRDCYVTNSIICFARDREDKGRTPTDKEIGHCRPNLVKTIEELQPEVIIPLGASAVKSLIGWLWKEDVGPIGRWVGWQIPSQKLNSWICPTWHPAYLLRTGKGRENDVLRLLIKQHLQTAFDLDGRPWEKAPDYASLLKCILDPVEAALEIEKFIEAGKPIAFDLECEGLKPDNPDLQIVSCSVSDGRSSIAFPWHGRAIKAMKHLLESGLPKIGFNQKYEQRWLRAKSGIKVQSWSLDGMLAAHVLDSRPGICSLEFQAFVLLGQEPWGDEIKHYLKSDGPNERNRIREVPLPKLLLYNAMDSLMECKVARIQAKRLGTKLNGTESSLRQERVAV